MTINIYTSRESEKPAQSIAWSGSIADFLTACDVDYKAQNVQPILVYVNGRPVKSAFWDVIRVDACDSVDIYLVQFGGVGKIFSKVFNFFFGWLMPKVPNQRNGKQGEQLGTSSAQANTAKLNQTVPETFGRIVRYPEYLVHPVRRFENLRTQTLEMLLCVGPGQYQADEPKIGNTPIGQIPGASYRVYAPGAALTGISSAENWYPAPEIGSTSGGTAGLELTASASSDLGPTGTSYVLDGDQVTSVGAPFPESWGVGTTMTVLFRQPVTITRIDINEDPLLDPIWVNELEGDWSEFAPYVGMEVMATGVFTGQARVAYVNGDVIRLEELVDSQWAYISNLPVGAQSISITEDERVYRVESVVGNIVTFSTPFVPSWNGFSSRTVTAADSEWFVNGSEIQGEAAGPFVILPPSEKTQSFEIDLFFPRGLHTDGSGNMTVTVEISYRDASQITPQPWTTVSKVYTAATLDQIGFTERIDTPTRIRPEVRVRRTTAKSTSSNVADEVQWYAARCLLETPTSYPWTTLAVNVQGLGKIASSSESRVSLVVQRVLPTLQEDGTWSAPVPTRDISAALWYICSTIGYGVDNIDTDELQALHELWVSRNETFDATLSETTAQEAIETLFAAGMAELTVEAGKLLPVRDGPRYVAEQVYSAQNTTREITRQFRSHREDDKDGVEVEYENERQGWAPETIICKLPDSPGAKLEKIKLVGVTDRNRAWRIGMRRAREMRYQRWTYSWGTELDALNSNYGSFVSLIGDQSALLKHVEPTIYGRTLLVVSEPLRWKAGEQHSVAIRRPDGSLAGPFQAFPGQNANEVTAVIPAADIPVVTMRQELPHVYFGPDQGWRWNAIVRSVRPAANDTCTVQAVNYDQRVYSDDDFGPDSLLLTSLEYLPQWETSKVYLPEFLTSTPYSIEIVDSLESVSSVAGIFLKTHPFSRPLEELNVNLQPIAIEYRNIRRNYLNVEYLHNVVSTIDIELRSARQSIPVVEVLQNNPVSIGILVKNAKVTAEFPPEVINNMPVEIEVSVYDA